MFRSLASAASLLLLCSVVHAQGALTVLDYGAEPRIPLRYEYSVGPAERSVMEMKMTMIRESNGSVVQTNDLPASRSTLSLRVTEVAADGSALLEYKTESAEGALAPTGGPAEEAAQNRSLAMLSRLSGTYRVDTRGALIDAKMSDMSGPGSGQALSQFMNDMASGLQTLPEEAIGVGAKWRVTQHIATMGMQVTQSQDFTLRSRNGSVVQIDMQMASPTTVSSGAEAGNLDISSETSGGGTMTVDLRKLMPTSTIEVKSVTVPPAAVQEMIGTKITSQMRMTMGPSKD